MEVPGSSVVKNPPTSAGDAGSIPGSGRSSGRGNTPVFLPGESHGQRSLEGCLWDNKESDMMEQLSVHTHRMTLYCLFSKMFSFYGRNVHI